METKYIEQPRNTNTFKATPQTSVWQEVKPFVKFGFKALGIMAGALIAIVKAIPKPTDDKPTGRVIKVK
ncbi:hypothetical protein DJ568_14755 [Mucilaginibacter hurinus]|uniref:Uncharacterized protein n=1 Tax=Mucilaginibacter hurinus TaxID=2201324 RepID=A0A367GKX8_9SPHI|nr:hypothetical protein [Mucilaginibacter hurinus]RCH54137.1 hypothetical protein DJ568_14755 [Mucilaginibacter hurinus]